MEEYLKTGKVTGESSIEQISKVYGAQAVVVSIDPKRVYVSHPSEVNHACCKTSKPGSGPGASVILTQAPFRCGHLSLVLLTCIYFATWT